MDAVAQTQEVAERIADRDYDTAMKLRGGSFAESFRILRTVVQATPRAASPEQRRFRLAVLHGGGPAPGMNTAVRIAVRLGLDRGHSMFAVRNGFKGLRDGAVEQFEWMDVSGWVASGGAELGTSRYVPDDDALEAIAAQIAAHDIDGLLMIGGWRGYQAAHRLHAARDRYREFALPIVCLPASINNDLPASQFSIGSDTALNSIVHDVDKIKQSAVASRRCFVVEVMGHDCGYLALMGGLASGAERVYLPEEGITLDDLQTDVRVLTEGFRRGKRLGLTIRSEQADDIYTTDFLHSLFEKEGGDLFDVRDAVLGHSQQGGDPSPFDRIQATRMAARCLEYLSEQIETRTGASAMIGLQSGRLQFTDLASYPTLIEPHAQRPREQRWMSRRRLAQVMARPEASRNA
jgi:6-phosphofructokinase 1